VASPIDRAFVEILPDFSKFSKDYQKRITAASRMFEREMQTAIVNVEARFRQFARSIGSDIGDTMRDATRATQRAADRMDDALDGIDAPNIDVDVDVDPRQVDDEVDDAVRRARPPLIPIDIDLDREGTFSRFLSSITGVRLPTAGFLALGSAAAAAAGAVAQLAAALAPAVGIIATLPAGIGVLAAGLSTLQVVTMGVGEAFEVAATGSAEEFSAAMEGLAPNVQSAAQAVRDLTPALDGLRDSVQQEFFENFDDVLNRLADTLIGPVTEGMTIAAGSMNTLIQRLSMVATSQEGVDFVTQSFEILNTIITNLQEPLVLLFGALLNVGNAIGDAFGEEAGAGLAGLITQFAEFLNQAAASGDAVSWVEGAMDVFRQLGDIIGPIVSIFGSIGDAAATTGGNILGVFGEALGVFAEFLSSAEGTRTLISLFEAFNTIGGAFGDILAGIGPALPPLIDGISNLASTLAPLIPPLAMIVGNLLTALAPLLTAVANAISPLIGPITTLAAQIGGFLVAAIEGVMPLIETLLTAMAGPLNAAISIVSAVLTALLPLFEALLPILEPILMLMTPFTQIFGMLAEVLAAILVPIIQVLGDILLWLADNVITPYVVPIIQFLADQMSVFLVAAIETLVTNIELMGEGFKIIWDFIKNIISDRVEEIVTVWKVLQAAFQLGWNFINNNVFTPIKNGINLVKTGIGLALDIIEGNWNSFVSFIKGIPGKISGSLSNMFDPLASGFKSVINDVIRGWNNLSISIPTVDIPGLGTVGGGSFSTPNIPYLDVGGLSMGEGLASLHPNEAVLPLEDNRTTNLMTDAIAAAISNLGGLGPAAPAVAGDITVRVYIDGAELTSRIDTRIDASNERMLRRARTGTGRRL
jgi:phage-related protein